jgi:molybdopterin synthase catalytic subunit
MVLRIIRWLRSIENMFLMNLKFPVEQRWRYFRLSLEAEMNDFPTITLITEDELDLNDLLKQITSSSDGAVAMFTGLVRGITSRDHSHETDYLEYEAYQPMAEAMMKQIADEIRARWNTVEGIAIVQRIGRLYPCTPTVLIACASPHRDTGVFDAARFGIDRLKQIVPVWKKEVGPSGQEWVEGDHLPTAVEASLT